jgi:hypothetical protein
MGVAVFGYGPGSGHQRLTDHLAAIDPLPAFIRAGRAVVVLFDLLEIQDVDEIVDGFGVHDRPWYFWGRYCSHRSRWRK